MPHVRGGVLARRRRAGEVAFVGVTFPMSTVPGFDSLTPEQREALSSLTPAVMHPGVMANVAAGQFTILDLFDSLPWLRGAADWTAWRAFLCAVYGLPMTDAELAIYQRCTGRKEAPTSPAKEVWAPVGRRARKSAVVAVMAVWHGGFIDHRSHLAPGERASIPILAKNKADAETLTNFVTAILGEPGLSFLLAGEPTAEKGIPLTTGVDIVIRAASLTAGRSKTIPLAVLEEVAFFKSDESVTPDVEILRGIRPAMATVPGALLVGISSPYARRGVLWQAYKDHFGKEHDPILVWNAGTLDHHDTPQIRSVVAQEYEADPIAAAAEYGAKFRSDVENYITIEILDAVTVTGRFRLPPTKGVKYRAFVDVSGGSADSFCLSLAHYDAKIAKAVQDVLEEWLAPFDPEDIVDKACKVLKEYGVKDVWGDRYAGSWPKSRFAHHGVNYHQTDQTKSDIYKNCLPMFNAGTCELLDIPRLRAQFQGLDRYVSRGRETIDHRPGAHDDAANASSGALLAADKSGYGRPVPKEPDPEPTTVQQIFNQRIMDLVRPRPKVSLPYRRGR